ncbi:MAG: response regulator transcription factor [Marinicella sp.]
MKILIVEDDINIADGLAQLMELEGYQSTIAHDGKSGLDYYQQGQFDLLIIDIMMPVMDGYELCKAIRKQDNETAIIMLSAKNAEIDKVVGLELGADDFISKPFGAREVIARIHAIMRRGQAKSKANDSQFSLSDLTIDVAAQRAFRHKEVIELSSRDIKILQLFHQHQGQVINRNMISDFAWGHDYLFNSRAIDQHIFQLRKRIELNPQEPQIIKTIHGEGYRYEK